MQLYEQMYNRVRVAALNSDRHSIYGPIPGGIKYRAAVIGLPDRSQREPVYKYPDASTVRISIAN